MDPAARRSLFTAVCVVGIALALALLIGFALLAASNNRLAQVISTKPFSSSGGMPADMGEGVVTLSGDRFAVVKDYRISVYRVDAQGKVHRTDDVEPRTEPMRPTRLPTPQPIP